MAIDKLNSNINQALNSASARTEQQTRSTQGNVANTATAPRQDAVSLTQQAQQLTQLQRRAELNSGVDQEKVDRIKKAISDGSYSVNPERLAAKIAHFESDMFGEPTATERRS
ncbi:MAG TPA: flagellar biosynthesis anti-sigma factor FlgM [Aliidiomarina sp.]|nr:flagellar biosynthesis anti-sigma factor FlgM [Aliidiomarina sp.]